MYPKYIYKEIKRYNVLDYLQKTSISACKLKTSIVLYKNYDVAHDGHNSGIFFPNPCHREKDRNLHNLFEGINIKIMTSKNKNLELVFKYPNGKTHCWGPNDI